MTVQTTDRAATRPAGIRRRFVAALALAAGALLVYRKGEDWLRAVLLYLSGSSWARRLVTGFGPAWSVASRFVAGESVDEAIAAARRLNAAGLGAAIDFLGESVTDRREALDARDHILALLDRIHAAGVDAYVSVKLSQLGLKLDENLALENLRALLQRAREHGLRIRIDMEESALVDITLDVYRTMRRREGFTNVGVVIQSALYRSDEDVRRLIEEGAWVRLVKGAYKEPPTIAYAKKADTDAGFVRLMQAMLSEEARARGVHLAVATHDEEMINATLNYARRNHITPDAFEFQMLYGVRRELQHSLVAQGWRARVYVPYGTAWYSYFMRRLAERPANLWFFVSNFFKA